jgi:ribose transport system substrate-binding protein
VRKLTTGLERGRRVATAALLVVAASGTLAACGSDSDSGSSSSSSTSASSTSGGASADVKKAQEYLDQHATGKNTTPLPDSAPAVAENKSIWYISCGEAAGGCSWGTTGAKNAVGMLKQYGWKLTVFDAKLDPSRYAQGIQQATVAKADAIILGAVDCGGIKPQLQAAKKAGIAIIGLQSFDCGDETQGGSGDVYTHTTGQGPEDTLAGNAELWGRVQAAWAIVKTGGDVKAVSFTNDQAAITAYISKGFRGYIQNECDSCKLLQDVPFLLADLAGPLQQKAATALLKNPTANIIEAPHDPSASLIAAAITKAGKQSQMSQIATLGLPQNNTLIKSNRGQTADVGVDINWAAFEAVDDLVRIFANEEPVNGGFGVGIIDQDNATPGEFYKAPVDYEANYKKIWKVN